MEHDAVDALRRSSAAWRLLRADTAPLILSFLGTVFVEENVRAIAETDLVARLDDHLYAMDRGGVDEQGVARYPRSPRAYIDHWAHPETGWLRAWYPPDADEPHYDATPAVEQAVKWVAGLRPRGFVGTESRLATVFDLLRQLSVGTQTDPAERIRDLEERRDRIDAEIDQIRAGRLDVLDAAAQRDRYQQLTHTASDLLSDFREVEANFRALDRRLRQRITGWDGAKGDLLDEVVAARSAIADSDQGRSFHAFYDFLLDRGRQEEFAELVTRVQALAAIGGDRGPDEHREASGIAPAPDRLRRIHYDWLDAGERTQATVRALSEQLRRFLDDRVWAENRRVIEILRGVEARALDAATTPAPPGMAVDSLSPEVALLMERPLFTPREPSRVDSRVEVGDDDFDVEALYDQVYVDPDRLTGVVREALARNAQVGLADIVAGRPLEHGLAELVTYLALVDPRFAVVHDSEHPDEIAWTSDDVAGVHLHGEDEAAPARERRVARLDRVTYARRGGRVPADAATPDEPPPATPQEDRP